MMASTPTLLPVFFASEQCNLPSGSSLGRGSGLEPRARQHFAAISSLTTIKIATMTPGYGFTLNGRAVPAPPTLFNYASFCMQF